ncbi:NAD(+) ADP-ribosyltransferase [Pseudothauera nasutitermitis]|uniref:NAD(+) ADP-ribosyltransferase n=1 Tax=Pseudothauera nasutitermitis TaxID=2565930 RepID=A0A4S4B2L1_9RHOO|nr:NAD(+)--dinitrogen-reductase ADP-D-ribosyltransferase [Pseudothauera nasutitermitis]THF65927.1 NAD(+) ADP-ribosyltransferase [Pseudothauera nasutitermitis]
MHEYEPLRWYTTNLVGVPAPLLASTAFNTHPRTLNIHGTRESHPGLFRLLAASRDQQSAAEIFGHYMALQFDLADPRREPAEAGHRSSSYVELLKGWAFDASSPQAAVLKGWVESRFGLVPMYHGERLARFPSAAWVRYLEEKYHSRFHNNCISLQLDALYEYCQWSLARFGRPGVRHLKLWRGSNDCEAQLLRGTLRGGRCVMRLNNLVSFSRSPQTAESFGDWLLEVRVPRVKLLCFPGLLGSRVLRSEGEYLVIGGDYTVRTHRGWMETGA